MALAKAAMIPGKGGKGYSRGGVAAFGQQLLHAAVSADGHKPELNEVILEVLEARNLRAADTGLFQSGKSDPYVVIKDVKGLVGDDQRTKVMKATLNPVWNQTFAYRFNYKLSAFKFKVKDSDPGLLENLDGDDPLGTAKLPIDAFFGKAPTGQPCSVDLWLPLKKAPTGQLHVRAHVTFNIPIAVPGMQIALPPRFQIGLAWEFKKKETPLDLDASVVGLDSNEQIVDQVWFKNLVGFGGAVRHSGDDTTGEGSGDDETITIDTSKLPARVEKLVVVINSFTMQPLSKVKFAYIRLIAGGQTIGFYGLGEGKVPNCTGLFFGVVQKDSSKAWNFVTTAAVANGRTVKESVPSIVAYGNARLGWKD